MINILINLILKFDLIIIFIILNLLNI